MDTSVKTSGVNPLVTILTATYNRANYIGLAIESAQRQTFRDWELLVLDDASTDDTEEVVGAFASTDSRIIYIKHSQNKGIAENRNSGLALARGQYVAVLDSDDIWTDDGKLEKQIAHLTAHPDCVAIGSNVSVIDENGTVTGSFSYETTDTGIRNKILLRNQFVQSSIMYRLDSARKAGGYDKSIVVNDDFDLWLRLGTLGTFANLPEITTAYREHSGGITKSRKLKAATEHLDILKRHGRQYPNYVPALLKSYARIIKAYL